MLAKYNSFEISAAAHTPDAYTLRLPVRTDIQCCILWYVDDDRKTYNPGLIITSNATDDEVGKIAHEMRDKGKNVRIFTSYVVDSVKQLPPLDKPIDDGLEGYIYDPWLIW